MSIPLPENHKASKFSSSGVSLSSVIGSFVDKTRNFLSEEDGVKVLDPVNGNLMPVSEIRKPLAAETVPLVSDVGREVKDLLHSGFEIGHKLKFTGQSRFQTMITHASSLANGIKMSIASLSIVPVEGAMLEINSESEEKLEGKYVWNDKGSGFSGKLNFPFMDMPSGGFKVDYRHRLFAFEIENGFELDSPLELGLNLGGLIPPLTVGVETGIIPSKGNVSKLKAAAGLKLRNGSIATTYDLLHKEPLNILLKQDFGPKLAVAAHFTVRPQHIVSDIAYSLKLQPHPTVTVKGRCDNSGKICGMVQHEFQTNSVLCLTGEWDTNKTCWVCGPAIGLSITVLS